VFFDRRSGSSLCNVVREFLCPFPHHIFFYGKGGVL
jgi:hypothetical protein